jgi:hypothetical protein
VDKKKMFKSSICIGIILALITLACSPLFLITEAKKVTINKVEKRISYEPAEQSCSMIYKNRIMWLQNDRPKYLGHIPTESRKIQLYDMVNNTTTQIYYANYPLYCTSMDIFNENIIYYDFYAESKNPGILIDSNYSFVYSISENRTEKILNLFGTSHSIWGNNIVVSTIHGNLFEFPYIDLNISVYNMRSKKIINISNAPGNETNADIWEDRLVWVWESESKKQLVYYNMTTKEKRIITDYNGNENGPKVYQDRIIWYDKSSCSSGPNDISGYYSLCSYNIIEKRITLLDQHIMQFNETNNFDFDDSNLVYHKYRIPDATTYCIYNFAVKKSFILLEKTKEGYGVLGDIYENKVVMSRRFINEPFNDTHKLNIILIEFSFGIYNKPIDFENYLYLLDIGLLAVIIITIFLILIIKKKIYPSHGKKK